MTRKSLAELAAAFENKTGGGGGDQSWKLFFPFWKAETSTVSTVRFLPDLNEDNPMGFLTENLTHELTVNGKREKVACLKMYGEDCPICALSQKYYDEKSSDFNEALGKKYYRKKSYIGQVLVVESPVEHDAAQVVKLIEFGPKIFNQIQAAFKSGDLANPPYELKGGHNFRIRKTKNGEYADYGTSSFAPKESDVADDLIEIIELHSLNDYRAKKVSKDHLEAMLIADQTGTSVSRDEDDDTPAPTPAPKTEVAKTTVTAQADTPAPTGEKKLSVVEQLRLRAQQKAAAIANAE